MALLLRWKVLLFIFFIQNGVYAQNQFTGNSLAPDPLEELIASIYGEDWLVKNQEASDALIKCVNERISYVQVPLEGEDKMPLLSSFPLMNKYNSTIVEIDYSLFNPESFVPLTYSLPFFSDMTQAIRVDGTDYVIVIQPLTR